MDVLQLIKQALNDKEITEIQDTGNDPNDQFDQLRTISFTLEGKMYEIRVGRVKIHGTIGS